MGQGRLHTHLLANARLPAGEGLEQRPHDELDEAGLALGHRGLVPVHEGGDRETEPLLLVALREELLLRPAVASGGGG